MITLKEYLENPCRSASLPFWKEKSIQIPDGMRIVHQTAFRADDFSGWSDQVYFRLIHTLNNLSTSRSNQIAFAPVAALELDLLAEHINACYDDLQVSMEQLLEYTKTPVYAPQLWLFAKDPHTGAILGSGTADYDPETRELILEWIQVHPAHRRKGIARAIVNELLYRRPADALFATVSGKANSSSHPEKLYRACGFTGSDYWHILHK